MWRGGVPVRPSGFQAQFHCLLTLCLDYATSPWVSVWEYSPLPHQEIRMTGLDKAQKTIARYLWDKNCYYNYSFLRKPWTAFKFSAKSILPLQLLIIPNICVRKLLPLNCNSVLKFCCNSVLKFCSPQPRQQIFTNLGGNSQQLWLR